MSDLRELDIRVAKEVMRWPEWTGDGDWHGADGQTFFRDWGDYGQITVYWNGLDACSSEWTPAQRIDHAFDVEDHIAELALRLEYVACLRNLLLAKKKRNIASFDFWWEMVHASPEIRCRAALECMKEKAKAAGG